MLKSKLSMLCILLTTVAFLQAALAAGDDQQAAITSLNSKLGQIQFTNQSPFYKDTGKYSYSFTLAGNNLVITYSEDKSFYRKEEFRDRYVESGILTTTTDVLDVARTETRKNKKYNNEFRVSMGCKDTHKCLTKKYTGTFYDSSGKKKSERTETETFSMVDIYVDSEKTAEEIKTELVKLLSN